MNVSNFDKGLAKMRQGVTSFSSGQLKALGGVMAGVFTVGKISAWTAEAINAAERITDVGKATGLTSEQIQTLTYLTTQYGGSVDKLFASTERLRKVQSDPIIGGKIAKKIEMDPNQFRTAPTGQVLESLAKYYTATGDAKTMTDALGRGSMELTGTLNQLARAGFAGATESAREFGAVMRDETIASLDELADRMDGFAMQRKRVFGELTVAVVDFAGNVARAWSDAVNESSMVERLTIFNPVVKFVARLAGQGDQAALDARGDYLDKERQKAVMARKQLNATLGQIEDENAIFEEKKAKAFADIQRDMMGKGGSIKIEPADRYASVGAFVGAQSSPESAIARQQIEILKRQTQWLEKHDKHLQRSEELLSEISTNTTE
jgi:hypothetical protein